MVISNNISNISKLNSIEQIRYNNQCRSEAGGQSETECKLKNRSSGYISFETYEEFDYEEGVLIYRKLSRLIDISRLASFIRDFPLSNLTNEERDIILEFEKFVVNLENREFSDLEIW